MDKINTKISVLMPVRNGSFYLPKIMENIIKNLREVDQIVIINDGSTDNTESILNSWKNKLNHLTVINTKGIGIVDSLNEGLKQCENDWIARFDVDDEYSNTRIKEQISSIKEKTVGIFSDYCFIDETGNNFGFMSGAIFPEPVSVSLINSRRTAHPVVLFNKEAVKICGGYQSGDFPAEDLSLWLRLSKIGDLVSVPQTHLKYRIRKGSITNQKRHISIQKKHEVIKRYGLNHKDLKFCNSEIEKILQSYNLYTHSKNRKILFLNDLISANKKNSNRLTINLISSLAKQIISKEGLIELNNINRDRRLRNKLREALN